MTDKENIKAAKSQAMADKNCKDENYRDGLRDAFDIALALLDEPAGPEPTDHISVVANLKKVNKLLCRKLEAANARIKELEG